MTTVEVAIQNLDNRPDITVGVAGPGPSPAVAVTGHALELTTGVFVQGLPGPSGAAYFGDPIDPSHIPFGNTSNSVASGDQAAMLIAQIPTVDTDDHAKATFQTLNNVTYLQMSNVAAESDVAAAIASSLQAADNLGDVGSPNAALNNILPDQAGNSGKVLTTNGADTSWVTQAGGGGTTLAALTDVNLSGLADLDLLQYQTSDSKWHAVTGIDGNKITSGTIALARIPAGATPGGTAGGDLGGTYPNPSVNALRGHTVRNASPTDGQILVWVNANTDWEPLSISGDATLAASGVLTLANAGVTANTYGDSSHVAQVTFDAKGRATTATNVAISGAGIDTTAVHATLDTDTTLAASSDTRVASQHAVKTYVDNAVTGLLEFKGSTDCSGSPNYPAANKGDAYVVSVAGKIGGASGTSVDVGDVYFAIADNAGGTQAAVGTSWDTLEHNLVGALLGSNNLSDLGNRQTALNTLAGAVTNHLVLAGDGANVTLRALAVADLPTGTNSSSVLVGGVITAGGPQGDASHTQVLTWNAAGQLTTVTNTAIAVDASAVTSGTLGVTRGGTGVSNPTAHAVYVGAGSSAMTSVGVGTSGQVLIGQGASADPAWEALTGDVTIANTGATTLVGTSNVESIIRANSLDQMTAAAANVSLGSNKIINLADGAASTDAATWGQAIIAAGKSGGQTVIGDTAASGNLLLQSTANATRGYIGINDSLRFLNGGAATYTATPPSFGDIGNSASFQLNFSSALMGGGLKTTYTVVLQQTGSVFGMDVGYWHNATYKNVNGTAANLSPALSFCDSSTLEVDNATITMGASTSFRSAVNYTAINSGTATGGTHTHISADMVVTAATGNSMTLATRTGLKYNDFSTSGSGTHAVTDQFAVDIAACTGAASRNVGVRCTPAVVYPPTVCTCTSNAATVPVSCAHAKITNSSAATCTITLTTTNALDGQELLVRFLDASAASQTVTFTNSETGKAGAPPTSLGSTTIPTTYRFIFNSGTSKWTYTGN
jgi:hypothetical protein